ncbi:unnamed protein product [Ilex paraguariensis]|uniref:Uncharacterized protein n=1 Tax=Ilex paraguariensis TaxID=185542 RepID=A0ABC8UAS5_9AQUA
MGIGVINLGGAKATRMWIWPRWSMIGVWEEGVVVWWRRHGGGPIEKEKGRYFIGVGTWDWFGRRVDEVWVGSNSDWLVSSDGGWEGGGCDGDIG